MANPDESLPRERLGIGKQVQPSKQPMPLGADIAVVLPRAWGEPLTLSHWDVWFARVASKDFGGDLNRLADRLGEMKIGRSFGWESAERKQCYTPPGRE